MRQTKFSDPQSLSLLIKYDGWGEAAGVEPGCAIGTEDFPMSFGSNKDVLANNELGIVVENAGRDDVHSLAQVGVRRMSAAHAAERMLGSVHH
jgi:hypothetical protein